MVVDSLRTRSAGRGFSLVELLVGLAVVALMLQIMLPAIQMAREAARRVQCQNQLRQVALAVLQHEAAVRRFPCGGWDWWWVGDPDRGNDVRQPGGWVFNVLDYMEQHELRRAGQGLHGPARASAIRNRCETPISLFYCPSRRPSQAYPQRTDVTQPSTNTVPDLPPRRAARSDYAINAGSAGGTNYPSFLPPPRSLQQVDHGHFRWPKTGYFNGICYLRSRVAAKHVTDGLSRTYLVGEKYLHWAHYATGMDEGDNENLYTGFNNDIFRSGAVMPMRDDRGELVHQNFGSAHSSGFHMTMADGSLRHISFSIELALHRRLANRRDGEPTSPDS